MSEIVSPEYAVRIASLTESLATTLTGALQDSFDRGVDSVGGDPEVMLALAAQRLAEQGLPSRAIHHLVGSAIKTRKAA